MESLNNIENRKVDHINICVNENVCYSNENAFDYYEFIHNALPEINFSGIKQNINFFGKNIDYPFLISSMTGGTDIAKDINYNLAIIANELNIPLGIGSQRQALKDDTKLETFKIVRKNFKDLFLISNIGAPQLADEVFCIDDIFKIIDMIEANALYIHLNPAQELFQKDGDTDFKGVLNNIEKIVKALNIPVLVKEVGAGINYDVAHKLLNVGVKGIDVSGASGTSWTAVEMIRNNENHPYFRNWGIPTTYCIKEIAKLKDKFNFTLIASGGIDDGIKIAKSIALGADLAASARSIIKSLIKDGIDNTLKLIKNWMLDLKRIQFLTGSNNIDNLKTAKILKKSEII
ncbi:MAG TPA: type 2 isopentenyl-diphosphate Delta-isomerase [Ignavibacteriales bacterium]|nr:type 2 isopentenyl-diphosphate Delta-isomerase [Ignavibacteriales bacterium]HOL81829.1 type 2 isopentenyl-diphosphate Delta-isomerase [Ignavibacteriales bacterium]HOM65795.1 type 2 isopentenyl-diphosphate Delta-isomerase [Ignavibacteriales bacterium]HPD67102.1 type 2 isopentenyl-diphosphate Delta-isomerase [Ignavibacteriales bacterium]HPP33966.1 type 2 isopentenyl-diphosphate Delta-isomerase [Ignavibacteriales bacterium]